MRYANQREDAMALLEAAEQSALMSGGEYLLAEILLIQALIQLDENYLHTCFSTLVRIRGLARKWPNRPLLGGIERNIGTVYARFGDYEKAIATLEGIRATNPVKPEHAWYAIEHSTSPPISLDLGALRSPWLNYKK